MADYRNSVDEQNARTLNTGTTLDSMDKLAQMLQQKQQFEATQQAGVDKQLREHALKEQGAKNRMGEIEQLAKKYPQMGVSMTAEGASLSPKPAMDVYHKSVVDQREEANRQRLIKTMTDQYSKVVGTSPKRIQAGQSVIDALNKGDITTLGRIKAQLPTLEGENFKPTDAEREIMLQPTAEGMVGKLKNFIGGDAVPASKKQLDALRQFVESKMGEEKNVLSRGRHEVLSRYKGHVKALGSDGLDEVASSLGMSADELLNEIQGKTGMASNQAPAMQRTSGAPSSGDPIQDELRRRGLIK